MLDTIMPQITVVQAAQNYGRFQIAPLDAGYGTTMGNALRRVLLSSIPGAAITTIQIAGIAHEFTPIPGVREDVTELVLHLKGVRMRSYSERAVKVTLVKQGPGVVRASDIGVPSTIELVNPDHYLCLIDDPDTVLEMDLTIERGYRVRLADHRTDLPIGTIAIDAVFTPVPKVNYVVEPFVNEQGRQAERLLLEIWTDGTIKPGDALSYAAQVLSQYSQTIASFQQTPERQEIQPVSNGRSIPDDHYQTPIDVLELSTRTYNTLKRANITTIGQVLELDSKALLAVRNMGQRSVDEIRSQLVARGYIEADSPPAEG